MSALYQVFKHESQNKPQNFIIRLDVKIKTFNPITKAMSLMNKKSFETRGPVNSTDNYVVERQTEIADLVNKIKQGRYIVIFAPRQTGKTTFFRWALNALVAEDNRYFCNNAGQRRLSVRIHFLSASSTGCGVCCNNSRASSSVNGPNFTIWAMIFKKGEG